MLKLDYPEVTIITVNYNGKKFLKDLFTSINGLNYPEDKMHTVMVDNGSDDDSCEFVRNNFPWVQIIEAKKNLGYAQGNNLGIKKASGKYIALINNDCVVDKNWLAGLVDSIEKSDNIAAVGSKVLFYYKYLPIEIYIEGGSVNISDLDISSAAKEDDNGKYEDRDTSILDSVKFLSGCSNLARNEDGTGLKFCIHSYALVGIPVPDITKDTRIKFKISKFLQSDTSELKDIKIKIKLKKVNLMISNSLMVSHNEDFGIDIAEFKLNSGSNNISEIDFLIKTGNYNYMQDIINSCGLEINNSFYARDRGFESFDFGQYDKVQEVFSPSGSSLIISRKMLDKIGFFDRSFFTYYEDVDLFWRARLMGWINYYTPHSIARHHHCGTSVEWSYSFTYHVIRNRILAIFKCGWLSLFLKSYGGFVFSMLKNFFSYMLLIIKGRKYDRPDIKARIIIFFGLFYLLPKNFISRMRIRLMKRVKDEDIRELLVYF